MDWDKTLFYTKFAVIPLALLGATAALWYGAFFILFGSGLGKLGGLALVLGSISTFTVGSWFALGRPRDWIPPGENTDADPRRL